MSIEYRKSEWTIYGGFFCWNFYFKSPTSLCEGFESVLCLAEDCTCPATVPNVPAVCTCLPCCTVSPKVGCCSSVKQLYEDVKTGSDGSKINPAKFGAKQSYVPVFSTCIPGLCSHNLYVLSPQACCSAEAACLCITVDGAFPPKADIPSTCGGAMCIGPYGMPMGIPFLMCYPKVGCCLKVKDIVPDKIAPEPLDIEPVAPVSEPPAAQMGTVLAVHQPMIVSRPGVVMVPVPYGATPGALLQILHPQTFQPLFVTVPPGAVPGQLFPVAVMMTQMGAPKSPETAAGSPESPEMMRE